MFKELVAKVNQLCRTRLRRPLTPNRASSPHDIRQNGRARVLGCHARSWSIELRFHQGGPGNTRCVTMGEVKQAPYRTVTRRCDEPKLEIGDTISIEEGLVGVVLARYMRSGDARNDVHYIVELRREAEKH
jgi:hypothetical protein